MPADISKYVKEAQALAIKVKRTGRVRPPKLDNGQMTDIGVRMTAIQKLRWKKHQNANGQEAKPLSKRYTFIKKAFRKIAYRPYRDLNMTGALLRDFRLRKAVAKEIRSEPTTRLGRDHAMRADVVEQMIGWSGSDQTDLFARCRKAFGEYMKKAWYEVK